ncbi:methylphosphotriester-DNA--protein-cysteine methyltransferase family protein [Clostridium sp. YIM B02505]|uniref:Methylphosphotriester-DNA--protein-cysteine methyltransferase family protein n=1 Tax=Clostridium yunnanense TaxID=2800325 RepID=A0ABS1EUS9_9CLOT|nr:Ada metal-binding domain-containing protein [Clostridium yunnanense]MBK1813124.1 methylphosphotriester-DNA--protein-cysteine methyltransferase family protein [Clostridium yunnanense]
MKKYIKILDSEKWQAVISCDRKYDGLFFYGVKTTGIFCIPSCKSKTPIRENVIFFDNPVKALDSGFRPCKRCCPDKVDFQPNLELVEKAENIFHTYFNKQVDLNDISKELGVSANHLSRLFKQHTKFTPTQYIIKLRVEKAKEFLKQSDMNILEVSYATGFKSLSNFYKCFKEQTELTPSEYRKSRGDL